MPSGVWHVTRDGRTRAEIQRANIAKLKAEGRWPPRLSPDAEESKRQKFQTAWAIRRSLGVKCALRKPVTEKTRALLRARMIEQNPMKEDSSREKMRSSLRANQEFRQQASDRMKMNNPMKRPEVRAKQSKSMKQHHVELADRLRKTREEGKLRHGTMTEESRAKLRERMKNSNPMRNPEVAQRVGLTARWRHLSDPKAYATRWVRKLVGPNKAEQQVEELLTPLGFKFVGDGKFWIGPCPSGKCRNPDFIYKSGRLKMGLLYHSQYWHGEMPNDDEEELKDYQALGWQVFVLWEGALPEAAEKVKAWLDGLRLQA